MIKTKRPSSSKRGYNWQWREFARDYLRKHSVCARCGGKANQVHHVHPLKDFPICALTEEFLESLCARCHSRITRGKLDQDSAERFRETLEAIRG